MKLADVPAEALRPPPGAHPSLRALINGAPDAVKYYLKEGPMTEAGWLFTRALSHLPPARVAAIGRWIADKILTAEQGKPYAGRMRQQARILRPDLSAEALHAAWVRNMAQVFAEYAVLHKLGQPDRLTVTGHHHVERLIREGRRFIFLFIHTGHWESIGWYAANHGLRDRCFTVYQPQQSRLFNRVVGEARRRHGALALPPGLATTRRLLSLAKEPGQYPCFAIDEVRDGQNLFPLFGRPPPKQGNLVIATHFARRLGAALVPMHCLRTSPGAYGWTIHPPEELDTALSPDAQLGDIAERLEGVYAPVIRDHLDQWYMFAELRL